MVKFEMNVLWGLLSVNLRIRDKEKSEENAEISADISPDTSADIRKSEEEFEQLSFIDENNALKEEYTDEIALLSNQFENELKKSGVLYTIPDDSDIPPRHNITDDVEIITDRFEKEVEDIVEGRR